MKILLSNDDGIDALGLNILNDLLCNLGHEVCVVAPQNHQSGKSNATTLYEPLAVSPKYKEDGSLYGLAVNGYPADCTKLGLLELYPDVDIVVTGINHGFNIGSSIYYSGTVAAAFEGRLRGKTSLALSLNSFRDSDMKALKNQLSPFLEKLLASCNEEFLYNINIPCIEKIKGIRVARQSLVNFKDKYEKRYSPLQKEYYWLLFQGFEKEPFLKPPKRYENYADDFSLIREGYITVTPIQYDLTLYSELAKLNKKFTDTE